MIEILYEDKGYIVCVKPYGVSSETDMPEFLKQQLGKAVYPVHRLDVPVSGVMVYAKDNVSAGKISRLIAENKDFKKTYLAICEGEFEEKEGVMEDLLFKDSKKNKSFVVKRERKGVRRAKLYYKIIGTKTFENKTFSLAEITLETGRSHQIRVQFASRKHPLAGDGKYGSIVNCPIALCSSKIELFGKTHCFTPNKEYLWELF